MTSGSGALATPRLYSCSGETPRRGAGLGEVAVFSPGVLVWEDGLITYAGSVDGSPVSADEVSGCVVPGFIDCHTHLPFYGWRQDEFAARLAGSSYRDLHGEGGISRSARMLREASDEEILGFCRPLVAEMAAHGTTAFEMKTGYGGSVEAELRQARLARLLASQVPQTCTVTLLGCHAVPPDVDREGWVRRVCDELIPVAAGEGLIDAVDIYVEDIAFTLDDLRTVAEAAVAAGLPLRCHADQLGPSGAGGAAVAVGARSADHLNNLSAAGVEALGSAEATAAVLLPASTLMLRAGLPPVTELLEAGAAIALSTDLNPGTSPVLSMPEVIGLGCSLYGVEPEAALIAATVNPAWVLGLDRDLGSLEVGKRADFLVLDAPDLAAVPYRLGHNPVAATYIGGALVAPRSSD